MTGLRGTGPPETYQGTVTQVAFVGLWMGDTMIVIVSSEDYFRKKRERQVQCKAQAGWLQVAIPIMTLERKVVAKLIQEKQTTFKN